MITTDTIIIIIIYFEVFGAMFSMCMVCLVQSFQYGMIWYGTQDAAKYAEGRGIFASGSPFDDVTYDGKVRTPPSYPMYGNQFQLSNHSINPISHLGRMERHSHC